MRRTARFGGRGEAYALECGDGYALMCAQQPLPSVCRVSMDLRALNGTKTFGLQLRHNERDDSSFALAFDCASGQVSFHRMPNRPWQHMESAGLQRVLACDPHRPMHLNLVLEDTLVTLYINDDMVFDARMYEGDVNGFGIFSTHGGVHAQNVLVSLPDGAA